MGENVSQIQNLVDAEESAMTEKFDLMRELCVKYRLVRKSMSAFLRQKFKKNFVSILYITAQNVPDEFIISLQKQYPDKEVKVMIPLKEVKNSYGLLFKFTYFLQNKIHTAGIYKIPDRQDNVQVYGVYTEAFSEIGEENEIYNIKYIAHYSKIVRKAALKLKPDIIHSDNIPLLMGLELGSRWTAGYPIKYIQTLHDYNMYNNTELFWSAINLANKKEMKKICSDNAIRSSIAAIFNLENSKKLKKTKAYINYIYTKYEEYRENVPVGENTRENVLIERMNERILKLFPNISFKGERAYNPAYLSMQKASVRSINFPSEEKPAWADSFDDVIVLPVKKQTEEYKNIRHPFNLSDFREERILNKRHVVRELSEKRVEMKFVSTGLFAEENVNIRGYLDSFFKAPLYFIYINEYTNPADIQTATLAVLKAFELRKNVQVVYNYPKGLKNQYLNTLLEFLESQSSIDGKWVALAGKINMPQFLSASDMLLMPSGGYLGAEDILYQALHYGCVPIVLKEGFTDSVVVDIFDDMNSGCVFKSGGEKEENLSDYEAVFLKALDFYTNNSASWNVIAENAMNYNSGWDFKSLEEYNKAYEELI